MNDVVRDFIGQLEYAVSKYYKRSIDLKNEPPEDFSGLYNYFGFDTVEDFNHFLYVDASLEVFGFGDQTKKNLGNELNMFLIDIEDEGEHEVEIVSLEINRSIPASYYFLSKLGYMGTNVRFVKKYTHKWDNVDVLITANPRALELKPEDKISVKINTAYNKESDADFMIDSVLEFLQDADLRNKILNTTTTTYDEL